MRTLIKNILLIIIIALNSFKVFAKDNLVTDLSESTVEISSTFSGADILLFGAYDGQKNDDIIVVVSGQKGNIKVDKKEKKFGIWMITESIKFSNIPKYYYIASNRKIEEITNKTEIKKRKLDLNSFELKKNKIDYKNAFIVKPNKKEILELANVEIDPSNEDIAELKEPLFEFIHKNNIKNLVVTDGINGSYLINKKETCLEVPKFWTLALITFSIFLGYQSFFIYFAFFILIIQKIV